MIQIKPAYLVDRNYNPSFLNFSFFSKKDMLAMPKYFTEKIMQTRNISTNLVKANWGNIFTIACERNYCLPLHQKKTLNKQLEVF